MAFLEMRLPTLFNLRSSSWAEEKSEKSAPQCGGALLNKAGTKPPDEASFTINCAFQLWVITAAHCFCSHMPCLNNPAKANFDIARVTPRYECNI